MPSSIAMRACVVSVSLASFAVLTPGCGGSAGGGAGGSGGGGGQIARADFVSEYVKAFCRRVYTCCDAAERAAKPDYGPTEADCVTAGIAFLFPANLQPGLDAGLIVYHGDRARRCVDNVAALSCADWGVGFVMRYVADCPQIYEGRVAEGGSCTLSEACASRYCIGGSCVALAGVGEPCMGPFSCQDGLYCTLTDSTCAAILPIGATCEESPACQNYSCPAPTGSEPRTCAPATCNGV